jgi:hypothetical protein
MYPGLDRPGVLCWCYGRGLLLLRCEGGGYNLAEKIEGDAMVFYWCVAEFGAVYD